MFPIGLIGLSPKRRQTSKTLLYKLGKMKIIYYSHTFFSDCDFPLIQELEKQGCEVYAYYHLSPWELNAGLIEISNQPPKDGVNSARNIEEMKAYKDLEANKVLESLHNAKKAQEYLNEK